MSVMNPRDWPMAIQKGAAVVTALGVIIGGYIGVEAWAEDKAAEAEKRAKMELYRHQAVNDLNHSRIEQSQRISEAETKIKIAELELLNIEEEIDERREEGLEPSARQKRKQERLVEVIETYERVREDATRKLTKITRTTTTTTTTTEETE